MRPERVERLEAVAFEWDPFAKGWDAHFELLTAYRAAHGDCNVPSNFVAAGGTKLGPWVRLQRQAHKAGEMRPERVERLEAVKFVWDSFADARDAHIELLQAYRAAHGDCAVPKLFVAADGTKLGRWVDKQRVSYKAGNMRTEHIDRLEIVSFVWTVRAGWDANFELLEIYHASHGDCAVPILFAAADGTKLGQWVYRQRQAHKAGKMCPERVERLEAAGFFCKVLADAWDAHFELLTAYHAAHGHCVLPQNFAAADGTKLGSWVNEQREAHKAGKMSPERVERLEAAGFFWKVLADAWDAHFELLTAYHAAHGHCAVPQKFAAADGTRLGQWVNRQRRAHKAGKMSPARLERLLGVDFVVHVNRRLLKKQGT
ncbi:helicase associated domain-containing protein [Pelagophyceae sp. CCMP2097]|nr:helicase associated domain-containing protein [Pelagophyceae sp. CCMP2097]